MGTPGRCRRDRRQGPRDVPDHRVAGARVRRSSRGPGRAPGALPIGRRMPVFNIEELVRGTGGALVGGGLAVGGAGGSIGTLSLAAGAGVSATRVHASDSADGGSEASGATSQ